jgi:RimJ/RimL family protein N-acetyltransferase
MTPITSARLTLRAMTHADVDTYVGYRSVPATLELMDSRVPPTPERVHARVDAMTERGGPTDDAWFVWAITITGNDDMIGDLGAGLRSNGGIADIGYVLRPEFRGQGYASEAAGALVDHLIADHGTHRIEAELSTLNMHSMRVLEAIGMTFESVTKLSCCVDGEWEDDLHYAMTADERRAWLHRDRSHPTDVQLVEVDADNADTWAALRTHYSQQEYVAPMLDTYRDALFPETVDGVVLVPWLRGITADDKPVGFMMTSTTYGTHAGCWYLWRLLIDRMHQRRGIGERAMAALIDELRRLGVPKLFTSCGEGPGSPRRFYDRLGFQPTGGIVDDHETELVLDLAD